MTPVFVDERLFNAAGLTDDLAADWDGGSGLWVARRLTLLAWLLAGGTWGSDGKPAIEQARAWWQQHSPQLHRWEPATLVTILIQLEDMGAVERFDEAEGGFHVQLAKELPL